MNIRDEREDLKQAAEQSLNVILDLSFDGIIRWASPSWKDVVGTPADKIQGTPIADILTSSKEAFADAIESMKKDDSRSQIVRFQVRKGISSSLEAKCAEEQDQPQDDKEYQEENAVEEEDFINLEGQGIVVYDRSSADESHVCNSANQLKMHWHYANWTLRLCGWSDLHQSHEKSPSICLICWLSHSVLELRCSLTT